MADRKDQLPECRFGAQCYRKNPDHLKKYSHPAKNDDDDAGNGITSPTSDDSRSKEDEPTRKRPKHNSDEDEEQSDDNQDRDEKDNMDEDSKTKEKSHEDFVPPEASFDDRKNLIKQYFLFDMPDDFYAVWKLAEKLKPKDPRHAFDEFGFVLCGPYDLLAGKMDESKIGADEFLLHCRYYYDPPEFQTVLKRKAEKEEEDSLFHVGYLRDEPTQDAIVCSNNGRECKLTIMGDNLFAAISELIKKSGAAKDEIEKFAKSISTAAEKGDFSLDSYSRKIKERKKKTVTKTFHGAGIVVAVENDVGYRDLGTSDDQLRKTLRPFDGSSSDDDQESSKDDEKLRESASSKLQELITYVQFANDECDFGMGYELGLDLFCIGYKSLHPYIDQLLSVAYALLRREQFKSILVVHLGKRRRGKPFDASL